MNVKKVLKFYFGADRAEGLLDRLILKKAYSADCTRGAQQCAEEVAKLVTTDTKGKTVSNYGNMDEDAMQLFVSFVSELSLSDRLYLYELHGNFFRIKSMEVSDYNQVSDRDIEFTATIVCDPGEYIEDGRISYDYLDSKLKQNVYSECHPTYQITGNGQCTITVNGKSMTATVGGTLVIDTGRMLAYQSDASIQNAVVTGDYEDLYFKTGNNPISITTGFELKVTPNWEVRIP